HRLRRRPGVDRAGLEAGPRRPALSLVLHLAPSFRRLLVMMRELNPPHESSPWRRPYSILGQRFMITVRPAASALAATAPLRTPSCIHSTLAPIAIAESAMGPT